MSPADLRVVPPREGKPRKKVQRVRFRPPAEWTLYDFLIAGLSGIWVWWVFYHDLWASCGAGVVILGLLLLKTEGPKGGPRGMRDEG